MIVNNSVVRFGALANRQQVALVKSAVGKDILVHPEQVFAHTAFKSAIKNNASELPANPQDLGVEARTLKRNTPAVPDQDVYLLLEGTNHEEGALKSFLDRTFVNPFNIAWKGPELNADKMEVLPPVEGHTIVHIPFIR